MKEVKKPWGWFKQFVLNEKCTVKILKVKKNSSLSLQKHKHRNEMWYFFGKAVVELGKKKIRVKNGDIVNVKKGVVHRVMALGKDVEFLEVAKGNFNEKDIVRLKDDYGRV